MLFFFSHNFSFQAPEYNQREHCSVGRYALSIATHARFWQLQMDYLRQMQNSFAGELSLQQALRDLTNVVPGSLSLDGRLQLLPGYQLREPGQIFRSSMTI